MDEPKFIKVEKGEGYYYDVMTKTIYGEEYGSKSYYHELSHYIDHTNPKYAKFSHFLSLQEQSLKLIFPFWVLLSVILNDALIMWGAFLMVYSIPSSFCLVEEIKASIVGRRLWKKSQK